MLAQAAAESRAAATASGTAAPASKASASTMPESASTAPADKSMPPDEITKVMPIASRSWCAMWLSRMFSQFRRVMKKSE